jgi:uncharacterized membrane protein (DUF4010 family)
MAEVELLLRVGLALMLGALIGAERERYAKRDDEFVFGGIRSFTLLALMGSLAALLAVQFEWIVLVAFLGVVSLIAISYSSAIALSQGRSIGAAGEFAALVVFLIGVLTQTSYLLLAVAVAIVTTTLLYLKHHLHDLLRSISEEEVYSTLTFAIVAFVILPFLPNQAYGPLGVLNPYKIWLMVVFICGMSYVGYVLMRIVGPDKGIGITGLMGGLASSTAVTIAFAQRSKEEQNPRISDLFVLATLLASGVMLVRTAVEVLVVNKTLLPELLAPLGVMLVTTLTCAAFFWLRQKDDSKAQKDEFPQESPFRLGPALKFGALFAVVLVAVKLAQQYAGQAGLYVASVVSGFVDADATTLSMAGMVGAGVTHKVAVTSIILAVMSNTGIKFVYAAMFGSARFRKRLGISFLLVMLSGLAALWLF